MEKKNTNSSSSKCANSDTKKIQDASNKHLHLPRWKESSSPRPDSRKKSNPQRSREFFDKRPKNRTGEVYERCRSEIMDDSVNYPISKKGCKKANLNHLLNFTLAPTEHWDKARSTFSRHKLPKYNKELFLQANCQFIVRENGNYTVHQKNPDILVDWSCIEEIRISCYEEPKCPICLHTPVAAKITRCGHVYCWPCVLHYLALTDKTWQKCPICFEAVHQTDLKSLSVQVCKSYKIKDEITMLLMKREKGSLLSIPVNNYDFSQTLISVNEVDLVTRYQKLLLAGNKEIQTIIAKERKELILAYQEEQGTPEACFIESALKLLNERENLQYSTFKDNITTEINKNESDRKHLASVSSTDSHEECHEFDENFLNQNIHRSCPKKNLQSEGKKGFSYFYQSEDGQHIYLHHINVRMLIKEFGCLEEAPTKISAELVEIERMSMTEVLRKKMGYLQHLPLTCEFHTVELDFRHLLSNETLHEFEGEIQRHQQQRNKKARDERRREKMILREENKKRGIYPKANFNINSTAQFPAYNSNDFSSSSPPKEHLSFEEKDADSKTMNYAAVALEEKDTEHFVPATSFAQMLKDGPKTFSVMASKSKSNKPDLTNDEDSNDEYHTTSNRCLSFSDAIQAALDSVTLQDNSGNSLSSKKKKKGKQQLLFTTSMCRKK